MTENDDVAAKIKKLRSLHISGRADAAFKALLDQKLMYDPANPTMWSPVIIEEETTGILVVGDSGSGKSQTVRKGIGRHQAFKGSNQTNTMPVLSIKVPTPITIKSLLIEAAIKTGYSSVSERKSASEIEKLVKRRMGEFGTSTLWIDEAQDLFKQKQGLGVLETLAMIKSMMQGDHPVVIVLSGTRELDEIAQLDEQIERRLSRIEILPIEDQETQERIDKAMRKMCDLVDIEPSLPADIVPRIVYASRNQLGRSFQTIRRSIECALQNGSEKLELKHFYEDYYRHHGCRDEQNIFCRKDWTMINVRRPSLETMPTGRTKRRA